MGFFIFEAARKDIVPSPINILPLANNSLPFRLSCHEHQGRSRTPSSITLRSKSRRARPQISNPKPISGPLPFHGKSANAKSATPARLQKDRSASNATTSDLVKRRYSSRFNQPEVDSAAPPVPELPLPVKREYGGGRVPRAPPSTDATQPVPVDLNALGDPNLPIERCVLFCPYPRVALFIF